MHEKKGPPIEQGLLTYSCQDRRCHPFKTNPVFPLFLLPQTRLSREMPRLAKSYVNTQPPYTSHLSPHQVPPSPPKKKHVCSICERAFTTSGHLARHSRVHTGERNHKCPFPGCETRCSRQDNLQQQYVSSFLFFANCILKFYRTVIGSIYLRAPVAILHALVQLENGLLLRCHRRLLQVQSLHRRNTQGPLP
jgi:hypothetical protein